MWYDEPKSAARFRFGNFKIYKGHQFFQFLNPSGIHSKGIYQRRGGIPYEPAVAAAAFQGVIGMQSLLFSCIASLSTPLCYDT